MRRKDFNEESPNYIEISDEDSNLELSGSKKIFTENGVTHANPSSPLILDDPEQESSIKTNSNNNFYKRFLQIENIISNFRMFNLISETYTSRKPKGKSGKKEYLIALSNQKSEWHRANIRTIAEVYANQVAPLKIKKPSDVFDIYKKVLEVSGKLLFDPIFKGAKIDVNKISTEIEEIIAHAPQENQIHLPPIAEEPSLNKQDNALIFPTTQIIEIEKELHQGNHQNLAQPPLKKRVPRNNNMSMETAEIILEELRQIIDSGCTCPTTIAIEFGKISRSLSVEDREKNASNNKPSIIPHVVNTVLKKFEAIMKRDIKSLVLDYCIKRFDLALENFKNNKLPPATLFLKSLESRPKVKSPIVYISYLKQYPLESHKSNLKTIKEKFLREDINFTCANQIYEQLLEVGKNSLSINIMTPDVWKDLKTWFNRLTVVSTTPSKNTTDDRQNLSSEQNKIDIKSHLTNEHSKLTSDPDNVKRDFPKPFINHSQVNNYQTTNLAINPFFLNKKSGLFNHSSQCENVSTSGKSKNIDSLSLVSHIEQCVNPWKITLKRNTMKIIKPNLHVLWI